MVKAPAAPPAVVAKPAAPRPQSPPMNPSSRRGETRMVGPGETCTSSRTTSSCPADGHGELSGAVGGAGWRGLRRAEPPTPLATDRLTADGTSVAAGGPSAAMPTATVRRGIAASDHRKRGRCRPRAAWVAVCNGRSRRRRPSEVPFVVASERAAAEECLVIVDKPIAPRPQVPDEPIVSSRVVSYISSNCNWRDINRAVFIEPCRRPQDERGHKPETNGEPRLLTAFFERSLGHDRRRTQDRRREPKCLPTHPLAESFVIQGRRPHSLWGAAADVDEGKPRSATTAAACAIRLT